MPTYERTDSFARDFERLSPAEKKAFRKALKHFVEDLRGGGKFRKGLRVGGVEGAGGVFEMTWAKDGRATFEYGEPVREGEPHVIWRRCGTHAIFSRP